MERGADTFIANCAKGYIKNDPLESLNAGGGFELDPDCDLTGPLDVEIGYGEFVYTPIQPGHAFEVTYGPQGGSHVYGAFRLNNPAPEFPELQIMFELLDDDACGEPFDDVDINNHGWAYSEEELGDECPPAVVGFRNGVQKRLPVAGPDGAIEQAGIIIFHVFYGGGEEDRVRLSVRDECGRVGTAEQTLAD